MKKIKIVFSLAVALALAIVLYFLLSRIIRLYPALNNSSNESDPMFAEEITMNTRPPELDEQEEQNPHLTLDDYKSKFETPVDMTVGELIEEAENKSVKF